MSVAVGVLVIDSDCTTPDVDRNSSAASSPQNGQIVVVLLGRVRMIWWKIGFMEQDIIKTMMLTM